MHSIHFFNTYIAPTAVEKVRQVLQTTFLSEGALVKGFEHQLTEKLGLVNPVAVNSGTSALHLALVVAGVGPGDEVMLPAQTFVATGLTILMTGATPVFVDIQYETGNICSENVLRKLTPRTKAIIPVHWGGYPCDLNELDQIAQEKNLVIIEDAAHAVGACYQNRMIGSISEMTCFSFQAIKHVTTGDGGAVAFRNPVHYKKAMALRWFGIDREESPVGLLGERMYDLDTVGFKYHLNNYAAALGLANLEGIEDNLDRRRTIAAIYDNELKNVPGVTLFNYRSDRQSSYWLYGFHVENRENFIKKLKEKGIPASIVHTGIDKNKLFRNENGCLPNQRKFDRSQIHIPVHNELNDKQVYHIVNTIKSGW